MKKFWEGVKEKVMVGLILSMLGIGSTLLWNFGNEIIHQPKTNKLLKSNDSAIFIRLNNIEKRNILDSMFLEEDAKNIEILKAKSTRSSKKTNNQHIRQTLKTKTK